MASLEIEGLPAPPDADVVIPGSKSITNRALLAAGLAPGTSQLSGVLIADDTEAMLDCVRALGAHVELDGPLATVEGVTGAIPSRGNCFARQSGTTARFVAPVLALAEGPWILDGDSQLRARPMEDLFVALRALGVKVEVNGDSALPATIYGPIRETRTVVSGASSSQFLSGLLLAAPRTPDGLTIEVPGPLVSAPYVEMTLRVMSEFGTSVEIDGSSYQVAPSGYRPTDLSIEPDASGASYFFAIGALSPGGRVRVRGLGQDSLQGDVAFVQVLAEMGADVSFGVHDTEVRGVPVLHGIDVDCREFSDTVPTLAVVAAFADSPTTIRGVGFIRAKESDRIGAVVHELRRCGVDAREDPDGMTINPSTPHGAQLRTYGDHRLAMAFAVFGCFVRGIEIDDPACVAKTFPNFFEVLGALR